MDDEQITIFIENEIMADNTFLESFFIHKPDLNINVDLELIFKIKFGLSYESRVEIHNSISEKLNNFFNNNEKNISFLIILQDVI